MLTATDKSSTAGAPSPDSLTGPTVRLWPYAPGVYGRDALYRVWRLMEEDGATKQAFWDEAMLETGGDLASFVRAFDGPQRLLLMIERLDTQQLCGCFWVSQIAMGHQAFVSMWMHKSSRGPLSLDASRLALSYTFETTGAKHLWALTPWPAAGALCRTNGFQRVGTLKEFCRWGDGYKDVTMYRLTNERFLGR